MKASFVARSTVAFATLLLGTPACIVRAQDGRIEGTVVVGDSPVDDADISIPGLGRRVRADRAGRFSFDAIPDGTYVLEAQSVRWGRGIEAVDVYGGQTTRVRIQVEAVFRLDEMIVSAGASATRRSEAYQPASVVTAQDLLARAEASLGETLSREPGVSSTYFGPGSSRPIIRGIGGDRVRVLQGGIGVGDASSTSPDHGVGVEARSAERIEVVRGPATLLYGSSAVGGVVNVLDEKIARGPATQPVSGYAEGLGGSVSDERTGSAGLTLAAGPLVITGSGLWRRTSDYSIPGFAEADPSPGEVATGVLDNSAVESQRATGGLTLVGDRGYAGVALTIYRSDYGVPAAHEEAPAGGGPLPAEAPVTIDLDQTTFDFEGAIRFRSSVLRNLKGRFGVADYEHVEMEGAAIGTRFFNDYFEGRMESEHSFLERTQGALGIQLSSRDFEAVGAEAFVPPTETRSTALFLYEEVTASDATRVQGGLRYERQRAAAPTTGISRTDQSVSASLGINADVTSFMYLTASLSRSVKQPNAEELFSNGPHAATQAWETGDPTLGPETALGIDLTAHLHTPRVRGGGSFFSTRFGDYIHESHTGALRDGLAEYRFVQADALFTGFELEAELDVLPGTAGESTPYLALDVMGDIVWARLTGNDEALPRIPAARLGGGITFRRGPLALRGSVTRTAKQTRLGPFETPTPGFTLMDGSASYRLFTGTFVHDVTLVANNVTNSEARLHTSFLKDLAPLAGRELRIVYRVSF